MELPSSVAARPNNARARAAAAWSVTVGAQQVTMPGAEGAKAACEGRGHLEGGEVARDRDWHGPSHLKRAWLKASTAILPLSPSFLCVAPRGGNPAGRLRGSRNKLSEEVICALLRDFREHGQKAIAKVRRDQPGIYLKVLALLI